ncbi:MAG TPA: alpha-glucuronidase family glycosyl hydrolase, partial [Pyrinomonadaceae bacterium]|nr:alpha-glucuronidase family glycosyl hydrolase [Pyrinomonadaceae bacterium]
MVSTRRMLRSCLYAIALLLSATTIASAEDGYRLWLRYDALPAPAIDTYRAQITSFVVDGNSASFQAISEELGNGLTGLLGKPISRADRIDRDGVVVV